ncbi:hypothetical protein MNBD_GAMMA21-2075 [hydrothermal vent metagenome]|uniref:AB hydrolase-1 domain-containing protein n=1 Tax=hydrothermal vent metagenome TaxID=652676 RepID=A0A3B1AEJ4_9ZZZZ
MKSKRNPISVQIMQVLFKWLGVIWPWLAASLAYRIWFKTPRYPVSNRELKWLELAKHDFTVIDGRKISVMRWGACSPGYILLIHGWSGRGSQLGRFVNSINSKGLGVISFDAPGHGQSDGKSTNAYQIASVINELIKQYGMPRAIIAHSFGGISAALAIREHSLSVPCLVTISCPTDPYYLVDGFRTYLNLNDKVMNIFNQKLYRKFSATIYDDISADKNLAQTSVKLLVVHDKKDSIVSWRQSEKLHAAVTGSTTLYTSGLGHSRILRDKDVIEQVLKFILS